MNSRIFRVLPMVLVIISLSALGQNYRSDSERITNIISEFYQWYFDLIRNNRSNEFNPAFVKTGDGMTTLDFKKYRQNLKKYSFEQALIEKRVAGYQNCLVALNKIKYEEFLTFKDLDDFESINCAFSNVYEWFPGMEPFDRIRIYEVNFQTDSSAFVKMDFLRSDNKVSGSSATIYVSKSKRKWLITEIKF